MYFFFFPCRTLVLLRVVLQLLVWSSSWGDVFLPMAFIATFFFDFDEFCLFVFLDFEPLRLPFLFLFV